MKLIVAFLLGAALAVTALADPPAVTFKQLRTVSGKDYTDVAVTAVLPDSIRITHDSGTASVWLADLPSELQKQFGYDPANAAAFSKRQAEQAAANRQRVQLNALTTKFEAVVKSSKLTISLRIISVLPDGILGVRYRGRGSGFDEVSGTVFVLCPTGSYVDGNEFSDVIYQCGTYVYTNTAGARATVLKYATSVEKATAILYADANIELPK